MESQSCETEWLAGLEGWTEQPWVTRSGSETWRNPRASTAEAANSTWEGREVEVPVATGPKHTPSPSRRRKLRTRERGVLSSAREGQR